MNKMWNLWHGCKKYSEGCKNCYVYRGDAKYDRDASVVFKTKDFDLPVRRKKTGDYVCPQGTFFYTCFTSDFLLDECDEWRKEAWRMINERSDCRFLFITKRIERFNVSLPDDWKEGYENVTVCVTCENSRTAAQRIPYFRSLPIRHKILIHEPLLEEIDLEDFLDNSFEEVVVGGESGPDARECRFEWLLKIRDSCIKHDVPFTFRQTGSNFVKDGRRYCVPRNKQHVQAVKANINYVAKKQL